MYLCTQACEILTFKCLGEKELARRRKVSKYFIRNFASRRDFVNFGFTHPAPHPNYRIRFFIFESGSGCPSRGHNENPSGNLCCRTPLSGNRVGNRLQMKSSKAFLKFHESVGKNLMNVRAILNLDGDQECGLLNSCQNLLFSRKFMIWQMCASPLSTTIGLEKGMKEERERERGSVCVSTVP